MHNLFILSGTNGTGKSTRVYALYKFLKSKGTKEEGWYDGKLYGRIFGDLLFIGKEIKDNNGKHWQGADQLSIDSMEDALNRIYKECETKDVILDSYWLMKGNANTRPLKLYENSWLGKFNIYFDIFFHPDFETYKTRIENRSAGKKIMTKMNQGEFSGLKAKCLKEMELVPKELHKYFMIEEHLSTEDVSNWGCKLFSVRNECYGDGFKKFCDTSFELMTEPKFKQQTLF